MPDLPKCLWQWRPFANTKGIAGVSTVLKKDGLSQLKLLMAVSLNFLAEDVKLRSKLCMDGGGAFSKVHSAKEGWQVACNDQSNACTDLVVPSWVIPYQVTLPIPVMYVMFLLRTSLKEQVKPDALVSSCYMRLATGFSHAVHILLQIKFKLISLAWSSERPVSVFFRG